MTWARAALPGLSSLPEDVWRQRQRWLRVVLWAHVAALVVLALERGHGPASIALHVLPVAALAGLGLLRALSPRIRGVCVALGLLAASAALASLWDGAPASEFHAFLVLALLALCEDWSLLLAAVVFVFAQHVVREVAWNEALTHTLFVAAVAIACVLAGRVNAQLREAARQATERFHSSFDSAPIGMAIVSLDGRLEDVNGALCEIVGHDRAAMLALTLRELALEEDRADQAQLVRQMLTETRRTSQRHTRFLHADGATIWVNLSLSLVPAATGAPGHLIAQVEDVTARQIAVDQLQHLADHDALTGLLNRRRLEQELEQQIALADRYRRRACLILLDLDDFKSINDSLGHAVGDELLRNIADVLRGRMRRSDVVARLGGDEFAILLPLASQQQAIQLASAIATAIRERVHISGGHEIRATASFGVAAIAASDTPSRVLLRADQAMYEVKQGGRDGVAVGRTAGVPREQRRDSAPEA